MKPYDILHDKSLNKSTAFSREERERFGLRGLLPYAICDQNVQVKRVIENLNRKESDIEKYIMLASLQDRNERLFYRTALEYIDKIMPIIYTPTVGQACQKFSHIYRKEHGFYINPEDRGQIKQILKNWPADEVSVIVITDGSRILGLGDLGANGMGIPIGKLALYTVCAGIHPQECLPVMFDIGTNNEQILNDTLYLGYPHHRLEDKEYYALMEEFIEAIIERYPKALIQFEDFQTARAFGLLKKYRKKILCFNDDIQGTAAVALAGLYASTRITGKKISDLNILFTGAGSAATGIADLIVGAMRADCLTCDDAIAKIRLVDSKGLVVKSRIGTENDLAPHKIPFAVDEKPATLVEAIERFKPDAIIGVSGKGGLFTREVIEKMSANHERPIIFALSNPTAKAECTAEQAYTFSKGQAVFASGSPFKKVKYGKHLFRPGQGNNAYIFPGIGLGALISRPRYITDEMFHAAAKALAASVTDDDIELGSLYPSLYKIRQVSHDIAVEVAKIAFKKKLARVEEPGDISRAIIEYMYDPHY